METRPAARRFNALAVSSVGDLVFGRALEAFTELLVYDCRLMNLALEENGAGILRDWPSESNRWLSRHAVIPSSRPRGRLPKRLSLNPATTTAPLRQGRRPSASWRKGLHPADRSCQSPRRNACTGSRSSWKAWPPTKATSSPK